MIKKLPLPILRLLMQIAWNIEDVCDIFPQLRKVYISAPLEDEYVRRNENYRFKKLQKEGRLSLLGLLSKDGYIQYIDNKTNQIWYTTIRVGEEIEVFLYSKEEWE